MTVAQSCVTEPFKCRTLVPCEDVQTASVRGGSPAHTYMLQCIELAATVGAKLVLHSRECRRTARVIPLRNHNGRQHLNLGE